MAITAHAYTKFSKSLADKIVELETDSLYVMLLSAYTPDRDNHQFLSDVLGAGTEAAGTGYTANGQALASVTFSASGHVYTLDCADPSWDASAGSLAAAYAVFYDRTPSTNATRPAIGYVDFGGTQTATGVVFTLQINSGGLLTFTSG